MRKSTRIKQILVKHVERHFPKFETWTVKHDNDIIEIDITPNTDISREELIELILELGKKIDEANEAYENKVKYHIRENKYNGISVKINQN